MLPFYPQQPFISTLDLKGFCQPFRSTLQTLGVFLSSTSCQIQQILPSPRLKMTSLLLKAFKWSSELADCQLQCLVARETHTHSPGSLFLSSPEKRGSCFKTVSNLAHSPCRLSAKSFLCCQQRSSMEAKGERMGVARAEGGKTKGLPHCCQGNLMSR